MTKKAENGDPEETLELDGSGNKEAVTNATTRRQRQKSTSSNRVKIIAVAAVCIVIIVLVCAWFIYSSLSSEAPAMIETIPGLKHHPDSSDGIIILKLSDKDNIMNWTNVVDNFLDEYESKQESKTNAVKCDYDSPPELESECLFDIRQFNRCTKENFYGYVRGTPCIFLKFNKIQSWVPEFYNETDDLPEEMPSYLKNKIQALIDNNEFSHLETVWVSCGGEFSADTEYIGPVTLEPQDGFPGYYFPQLRNEDNISPLVAVHFEKLQSGILINVECRLWARNIEYNKEKGTGFVSIKLMIDA